MAATIEPSTSQPDIATHTILVCTTCASTWRNGQRVGESGGEKLLQQLQQQAQDWELKDKFAIQAVECMSACSHACAIAFTAPGKHTYLFGDIPTDNSAATVLTCASLYHTKTDGLLAWSERPEPLKKGVIARIPPLAP